MLVTPSVLAGGEVLSRCIYGFLMFFDKVFLYFIGSSSPLFILLACKFKRSNRFF